MSQSDLYKIAEGNQVVPGKLINWLLNPVFASGSFDGATIGLQNPSPGTFSSLYVPGTAVFGAPIYGDVIYTPAGTGAVTTTVQTKLRESVSVKGFGAVGNGVKDDTAAIISGGSQ